MFILHLYRSSICAAVGDGRVELSLFTSVILVCELSVFIYIFTSCFYKLNNYIILVFSYSLSLLIKIIKNIRKLLFEFLSFSIIIVKFLPNNYMLYNSTYFCKFCCYSLLLLLMCTLKTP